MLNRAIKTLLILSVGLLLNFFSFHNAPSSVSLAQSTLSFGQHKLEISKQAQAAIDSGVKLTINCDFANTRNFLGLTFTNNTKSHFFIIQRHVLSNRYMVKQDHETQPHMFRSIGEASNYVMTQAMLLLELYAQDKQTYAMRLSLNKFKLPGPMRLAAFFRNDWDLDTGWIAWTSKP